MTLRSVVSLVLGLCIGMVIGLFIASMIVGAATPHHFAGPTLIPPFTSSPRP